MTPPELPDDIWLEIYARVYRAQFNKVMRQIDRIHDCWTTMDYNRKEEMIIADTFWGACRVCDFEEWP